MKRFIFQYIYIISILLLCVLPNTGGEPSALSANTHSLTDAPFTLIRQTFNPCLLIEDVHIEERSLPMSRNRWVSPQVIAVRFTVHSPGYVSIPNLEGTPVPDACNAYPISLYYNLHWSGKGRKKTFHQGITVWFLSRDGLHNTQYNQGDWQMELPQPRDRRTLTKVEARWADISQETDKQWSLLLSLPVAAACTPLNDLDISITVGGKIPKRYYQTNGDMGYARYGDPWTSGPKGRWETWEMGTDALRVHSSSDYTLKVHTP